ncbi:Glycosyl transferase family 2 [Lachnospiraceae bacterium XBB2008]|nr:Glycosyl transferase family 2 [Lachnospiraceae bacterium XBB2008]
MGDSRARYKRFFVFAYRKDNICLKMKRVKVSIITVCLNSEETIEQTINSVLSQDYDNIEYIIVDGGSSDRTCEIIEKHIDSIAIYISEKDDGIYYAMNKGISASTGEIIGIVNSDDWLEPMAIERVVDAFTEENVDIVHGNINSVDAYGQCTVSKPNVSDPNPWLAMMVKHPATFVRKRVYDQLGVFRPEYSIAADYEFILRCYTHNMVFRYIDSILSNFRRTGISESRGSDCLREVRKILYEYREYIDSFRDVINARNIQIRRRVFYEKMEKKDPELMDCFLALSNNSKSIAIWGAGTWGKNCVRFFRDSKVNIRFIADGDSRKIGTKIEDVFVVDKEMLLDCAVDAILVSIINLNDPLLQEVKKKHDVILIQDWVDKSKEDSL